jgi:hypothetical protein
MLESCDFHTSFLILSFVHDRLRARPLGQLFNLTATSDRFDRFVETVCRRHGTQRPTGWTKSFRYRDA